MKLFITRALAACALACLSLSAGAAQPLQAGRDFTLIEPAQTTDNAAKIEVIEFFSYACPHCGDLNPHVLKWAGKLPSDVVFRRVPVSFGPFYQLMARLFYTLEAIGELSRLDNAVFTALHDKGLKLIDDKSILEWVTAQGVDAKKFNDAFTSFGVISKTKRAHEIAQLYKIQGVPSLAVDGRYMVVGQSSPTEHLAMTDKVIAKRRAERSGKK